MKRLWRFFFIFICIFIFVAVSAIADDDGSFDYTAGALLGEYLNNYDGDSITQSPSNAIASYHGVIITRSQVEYQRKLEELSSNVTKSDLQIANEMLQEAILLDEAERLGLGATAEEISTFMKSILTTYTYPDGKDMIDEYCAGAGITVEEYFSIVEDNVPAIIAQQKISDEIGRRYCQEHGLQFTKINPPQEMMDAIDAYIEELFESHKDEIVYYIEAES